MKDKAACKPLLRSILLSYILLLSSFAVLPSVPAVAQTAGSFSEYVIDMNLLPSSIELDNTGYSTGYVGLFSNAEDLIPAISPRDLRIELSSSNSTVASVPAQIVIPSRQQYAVFDIALGDIEGEAEITALFGNQIVAKNIVISQGESQIPPNVKLAINLPSNKMQVGAEMPVSFYLEHEGGAVQAPQDVTISLDYSRNLLSLSSDRVTIEKGNYYAIVNVRTLEKAGFAFIEASTVGTPSLNTVKVVEIAMTQPASLKTYVFPDMIGPSEKSIDIFVALLDSAGNPTIAPEDIKVSLFSNSLGVTGISDVNAIIKKGEYGYHLRQPVSFLSKQAAVGVKSSGVVEVAIGATSSGLGSSSASFKVMPEDLTPENVKATEKAVKVFTVDKMPSDANAIVVYQIVAVARDFRDADYDGDRAINTADDTAAAADNVPLSDRDMNKDGLVNANDFHAIDNLDDNEQYPIRSSTLFSTGQGNLDVVSSNIESLRITDSGSIVASSSYGTAKMSSERLGANLGVSVSLQTVGGSTGSVTVVSGLNPVQTLVVSPIGLAQDGNYRISFNGDGYSDLFVISVDSQGRPARSANGISYLVEPINELAEIEPGRSFAIVRVHVSSFTGTLGEATAFSVTPIGVNADPELKAESTFYLSASTGTTAKVTFPFASIIGYSTSHDIGTVQLVDSTGNQILASDDLAIRLSSSDSGVMETPPEVIIPQGKSFVHFPVTTFGRSGNVTISASAEGVGPSTAKISSVLTQLEGSFLETSGLIATIPQDITISTTLEGTNVLWGYPPSFEIVFKDEKALTYDPETDSYLASMQVVADREGDFVVSATLLKDGFEPTKIVQEITFSPYLANMIVSIDYQQPTIPYNHPTTINILVEGQDGQPIEGAMIQVSPGMNATAAPEFVSTDANGMASFVYTSAGPNPKVLLELIASKDGYVDGIFSKEFEVTDLPTALPPWVTYAAIAGVVASIGGGIAYFMKKPKGKRFDEEVEEEDEEI